MVFYLGTKRKSNESSATAHIGQTAIALREGNEPEMQYVHVFVFACVC